MSQAARQADKPAPSMQDYRMRSLGATRKEYGSYYKAGRFGHIFWWLNGCWVRSARTHTEFLSMERIDIPRFRPRATGTQG